MRQIVNLRSKLAGISPSGNYMFARRYEVNDGIAALGRPAAIRTNFNIGQTPWASHLRDVGVIKDGRLLDADVLCERLNNIENMRALMARGFNLRDEEISNRTLFFAITGRLAAETPDHFLCSTTPQADSLENIPCGMVIDVPGPVPVIIKFSPEITDNGLSEELAQRIADVISRKNTKGAHESGRSLLFDTEQRLALHHEGTLFATLVSKGVTHNGKPPEMTRYVSPQNAIVSQSANHLVYGTDGYMDSEPHPAYPKGGIYLYQALTEYLTMRYAFFMGIPTPYPIGIGIFPSLIFNGLPLGFVIKALPKGDTRYGSYINSLFVSRAKSGDPLKKIIRELAPRYSDCARRSAATLFRMNSCGATHSEPHPDNFSIPANTICSIHDFTSARILCQLTLQEFTARMFEDFIGGCKSVFEGCDPSVIGISFSGTGIHASPSERFVKGYFENAGSHHLSSASARKAISKGNMADFMFKTHAFQGRFLGRRLSEIDNPLVPLFENLAAEIYSSLDPNDRRAF